MDIEFLVHDIYTDTRPQWKLASNLEEASKAFQLVLAQDRKAAGLEEPEIEEQDDELSGPSTEDELADGDAEGDADDNAASDDGEGVDDDGEDDERQSSDESDDEAIIVTRQEEEFDPEWDAEFEREYAKMMSESSESRKLDRRPVFDIALPIRPRLQEPTLAADPSEGGAEAAPPKMAFAVLTKKGNKQQVRLVIIVMTIANAHTSQTRTLELPTDSQFAVAMRNQQQAEREEQQRIKNLVLSLDLRESDDPDSK